MNYNKEAKEHHDNICKRIKELAAEKGDILTDDEAFLAANNLIGFCETVIKIRSRDIESV